MSNKAVMFWFVALFATSAASVYQFGTSFARGDSSVAQVATAVAQDKLERKILYWYDPMVPDRRFDKPGKSPFMDMQLVPQYADAEGDNDSAFVHISPAVAQNLGIRLARVAVTSIGGSLHAVGRVSFDERRLYTVQTRAVGFVEHLFVRAVGDHVVQGQKIAEVYAPDLLAAQLEYLALFKVDGTADVATLRQYARDRLRLLGMVESEIDLLVQQKRAAPRYGVYAPVSGVVTELSVREGGQIMPGTNLLQIADLSTVWLVAELSERDATRIKVGDKARIRLESFPGTEVNGQVEFIYPDIDAATRSVRLRIVLANPRNNLRPGMFATADVTGVSRQVLAVPSESVIATGTRRVVIVKELSGYRPVEVTVGQESDGKTEVLAGVKEGEEIVVSGQFLIDSEASLKGVLARVAHATESASSNAMKQDTGRD